MGSARAEEIIKLRIPSKPQMTLIVRLTTAGVMARAGLSMDEMGDLKLAVEEACTCMTRNSKCHELELTYSLFKDAVCVTIVGIGEPVRTRIDKTDLEDMEIIQCILRSMVDEVETEFSGDELVTVHMQKKITA